MGFRRVPNNRAAPHTFWSPFHWGTRLTDPVQKGSQEDAVCLLQAGKKLFFFVFFLFFLNVLFIGIYKYKYTTNQSPPDPPFPTSSYGYNRAKEKVRQIKQIDRHYTIRYTLCEQVCVYIKTPITDKEVQKSRGVMSILRLVFPVLYVFQVVKVL